LLAAATSERTQARKALRETNEALEQRVEDRTRELSEREAQVGASLREKELLLREMHHRVKNNLQIISSLLRLQRRSAADARTQALLSDCEDRVRSIAFVHEELYRSNDLSTIDCQTYLQTLVASLKGAYELDPYSVSIEVDARDCALSIDRAIPCGLVVNELVSNALKHAFNERRRGHLSVVMTTDPEAKGYLLLVCDDGVGFPPGVDYRSTQTLGLKLVCSLVAQMHGVISLERDGCTRFIIRFPP
jgi:two-component sensor histidine kinase